jgi:acetylornithine/succinyldiaminopimelate/putrescine aminotransferase
MSSPDKLSAIRAAATGVVTSGLAPDIVERFRRNDPTLERAIDTAWDRHQQLLEEEPELLALGETELVERLQAGLLNFYPADSINRYVPLAARGPWVVTSHGAVLHDSGGYGMLGLGHAPPEVEAALATPQVMANVMTASFSQARFLRHLRAEVGHRRPQQGPPYERFVCLNSGSESMTFATRVSDLHAGVMTGPDGPQRGKSPHFLVLAGSFHGRTSRPAQLSNSTAASYRVLASFRNRPRVVVVPANDGEALIRAFEAADRDGIWFEAVVFEPVQGEGNPGLAVEPEFYALARRLSAERSTLLIADSIQAGLRAHGVLSMVDYPGFEELPPPDIETWSKALNAGQYPLSVVGLGARIAGTYQTGLYGNTMTTNPRGLDVACAVLDALTPELRTNIRERGAELKAKLEEVAAERPERVLEVKGTGLLVSVELDPEACPVTGPGGLEELLRSAGIGVIHGGRNALRFTPHFRISSAEVDLIVDAVREALRGS